MKESVAISRLVMHWQFHAIEYLTKNTEKVCMVLDHLYKIKNYFQVFVKIIHLQYRMKIFPSKWWTRPNVIGKPRSNCRETVWQFCSESIVSDTLKFLYNQENTEGKMKIKMKAERNKDWRRRQYVPPKRWYLPASLRDVTTQNTNRYDRKHYKLLAFPPS